jgi:hypothetical protein
MSTRGGGRALSSFLCHRHHYIVTVTCCFHAYQLRRDSCTNAGNTTTKQVGDLGSQMIQSPYLQPNLNVPASQQNASAAHYATTYETRSGQTQTTKLCPSPPISCRMCQPLSPNYPIQGEHSEISIGSSRRLVVPCRSRPCISYDTNYILGRWVCIYMTNKTFVSATESVSKDGGQTEAK